MYPSGGTQWKKIVSCQRLWVIRFASSPTQNTGIEIPIRARIIRMGSIRVPLNTAAAIPIASAMITQITAAPNTSDSVAGVACTISGTIFWPWFEYDTRSRVMRIFFIISRYCTGSGRSRPNWCRISFTAAADGLRPAIWRTGSIPGVWKKIMNTTAEITNITSTICSRRLMMNVPTAGYAPTRSFARGSSASRTPSPNTFSESTVITIMMPGAIATHGRV